MKVLDIKLKTELDLNLEYFNIEKDIRITIEDTGTVISLGKASAVIKDPDSKGDTIALGDGNSINYGHGLCMALNFFMTPIYRNNLIEFIKLKNIALTHGSAYSHKSTAIALGAKASIANSNGDEHNMALALFNAHSSNDKIVWSNWGATARSSEQTESKVIAVYGGRLMVHKKSFARAHYIPNVNGLINPIDQKLDVDESTKEDLDLNFNTSKFLKDIHKRYLTEFHGRHALTEHLLNCIFDELIPSANSNWSKQ